MKKILALAFLPVLFCVQAFAAVTVERITPASPGDVDDTAPVVLTPLTLKKSPETPVIQKSGGNPAPPAPKPAEDKITIIDTTAPIRGTTEVHKGRKSIGAIVPKGAKIKRSHPKKKGRGGAAAKKVKAAEEQPAPDSVVEDPEAEPKVAAKPRDEEIESLQEEIRLLKDRKTLKQAVEKATQTVEASLKIEAASIYNYKVNAIYTVLCSVDHLVDIQLQPGEVLTGVGAGDTTQWILDKVVSGVSPKEQTHIFLKPTEAGLTTNFTLTTNRHTYHLAVKSTNNVHTPIISWLYPSEENDRLVLLKKEEDRIAGLNEVPSGTITAKDPAQLNFNYKIKKPYFAGNPVWTPEQVFDDGSKTFLKMPKSMNSDEAPVLFIVNDDSTDLVNYRVSGDMYIVDRLFNEAELRVGETAIRLIRNK